MPESQDDGRSERQGVALLYGDIQRLFAGHDAEVITFGKTVAILSGYIPRPPESDDPEYDVVVMSHIKNEVALFLVKISLRGDEDSPSVSYVVGTDRAKYSDGDDETDDLSAQDIRLQRDVMRDVVIDNEEARYLVDFMNNARDELGYGEDEFF